MNFIKINVLLLFVVFSQICLAQTDSTKSTKPVFTDYETLAEFPGGQDSLNWFIMENLEYPKEALENDISGIVYLMFVVDKNGYVNDVTVEKIKLRNIIAGVSLGIPNVMSIVFFLKCLNYYPESTFVFPINNVGIVAASAILASLLFKERLSKTNWIGIGIAITSILLISIS